jgi:hypothetical protein
MITQIIILNRHRTLGQIYIISFELLYSCKPIMHPLIFSFPFFKFYNTFTSAKH